MHYETVSEFRAEVESIFQQQFKSLNDNQELLTKAINTSKQFEGLMVEVDANGYLRDPSENNNLRKDY